MSLHLLFSKKDNPILVYNQNKFYRNKIYRNTIYWYCSQGNKQQRCRCIIHTNLDVTKIVKYCNPHNHPPTYSKDKSQREQCIKKISMYNMKVKDAFTCFSINHPQLSLTHFDKLASIKRQIYRKQNQNHGQSVPKTFNGTQ